MFRCFVDLPIMEDQTDEIATIADGCFFCRLMEEMIQFETSRVYTFGITRSSQSEVSDRQSVDKMIHRRATKHPKAKQNSPARAILCSFPIQHQLGTLGYREYEDTWKTCKIVVIKLDPQA